MKLVHILAPYDSGLFRVRINFQSLFPPAAYPSGWGGDKVTTPPKKILKFYKSFKSGISGVSV